MPGNGYGAGFMMAGSLARVVAVAGLSLMAAACAGVTPEEDDLESGAVSGRIEQYARPVQCVPYARIRSGISIYGDAWTWWNKAAGVYLRSTIPKPDAVLVLDGYAGPERAHLAVVRSLVSAREIRVDHANWLNTGAVYLDDPIEDVSAGNDWSLVKVFNPATGIWGTRVYRVRGFIGPEKDPLRVATDGE